jgi:hypothetical protein
MSQVPSRLRLATILSAAFLLPHCSAMHAATFDGFDQGVLNSTWYGPYSRPVDRASEEERAAAAERARDRAAAAVARREARQDRRAERRQQDTPEQAPDAESPQESIANNVQIPSSSPSGAAELGDGQWSPALAAEYVRATYALNGAAFDSQTTSITDMYRLAVRTGAIYYTDIPAAGDVVFFNHTWDRNDDGRDNDFYTHAGIVEYVDDNGTISFLSYVGGEVAQYRMNLIEGQIQQTGGEVYNTPLRERRGEDGSAAWLTSHLFAGFAAFLGPEVERVQLLDDWTPDEINGMVSSR